MSVEEAKKYTFYFCNLKSSDDDCPKKENCKRYKIIEDIPVSDYDKLGFAKLKNVCNRTNYSLFMELDTPKEEVKSVDEELHDTGGESD